MAACVILRQDDKENHEFRCDCGLCNRNGDSYGVAIFPRFMPSYSGEEPLMRIYGASEAAAYQNARLVCAAQGWVEIEEAEED